MTLQLIRGDTYELAFTIQTENGVNYVLEAEDSVYFTVKKYDFDKEFIIQKTYGNGISYDEKAGEYVISLTSDDTDILCGTNKFDIKVIIRNSNVEKTLIIGSIVAINNVTHKENE